MAGDVRKLLELGVRLSQRLKGHLLIVDIGASAEPTDGLSLRIAKCDRAAEKPPVLIVRAPAAILDLVRLARRQRLPPQARDALTILGMHDKPPAVPAGRFEVESGIFVPPLVVVFLAAIRARDPHQLRHAL